MAKKTDYTALTEQVCDLLGGKSNIGYFTHCVTRLRFSIKDKGLVKEDELRSMEGVGGLRWVGTQLQIIIGSGVEEVYTAICKKHGFTEESAVDETLDDVKEKPKGIKGYFSAFVATLSAILGPIIPAIVACGLLQGLLYSAQSFGWIDSTTATYTFFFACAQASFYFLPILVAFSAAKVFKCNPYLAVTTAAILISPVFIGMAGTTVKLFGFLPIKYADYSSSVVPAILTVYFQSFVEKGCKKIVPKMIDIIVTPLITVFAGAIAGWILLAPIGGWIGTFISDGMLWLYTTLGPIGGAVIGAVYPFQLMTGMQVANTPIIAQNLATLGYDFIYPCIACSNAAMAMCALVVFFKAKKEDVKSLGLSTGVTALIGVTEPVLFGLILRYKKALWSTIIGGAVGGAIMGMFVVKYLSFGFVPFGTIILAFTDTFAFYMLGVLLSMAVAAVMMFVLKWED